MAKMPFQANPKALFDIYNYVRRINLTEYRLNKRNTFRKALSFAFCFS